MIYTSSSAPPIPSMSTFSKSVPSPKLPFTHSGISFPVASLVESSLLTTCSSLFAFRVVFAQDVNIIRQHKVAITTDFISRFMIPLLSFVLNFSIRGIPYRLHICRRSTGALFIGKPLSRSALAAPPRWWYRLASACSSFHVSRHAVRILQQNRSLRCSMRPDRCSPDRVLSLPSPDPSKNSQCRLLHKWRLFHQKSATTSSWQLVAPKPVLRFRLRAECRRALQLPSFSQKSSPSACSRQIVSASTQ